MILLLICLDRRNFSIFKMLLEFYDVFGNLISENCWPVLRSLHGPSQATSLLSSTFLSNFESSGIFLEFYANSRFFRIVDVEFQIFFNFHSGDPSGMLGTSITSTNPRQPSILPIVLSPPSCVFSCDGWCRDLELLVDLKH